MQQTAINKTVSFANEVDINIIPASPVSHVTIDCPEGVENVSTQTSSTAASTKIGPKSLRKAIDNVTLNGKKVSALMDSGSSHSFIHPSLVNELAVSVSKDDNGPGSTG